MVEIREVFDVRQHPQRNGEITELERRVQKMEGRFSEVFHCEWVDKFLGFRTNKGTLFFVNAIYEWNCVFLEYGDGEDGDKFPLELDEETMFKELLNEVLSGDLNL